MSNEPKPNKKTIDALVAKAAEAREANKDLIRTIREQPDQVERVKGLLCEDLRRVYAIPRELLGPSASRQRYRQHGHYSDWLVTYLFGTWAEFQRQAKIEGHEPLAVRRVASNVSKTLRAQTIADYAEECVKPWDNAYNTLDMQNDHVTIVIGSDFHSKYIDPFARRVWMDVCKRLKPDGVRFNGDGPDFPQLSRHRQLPGHFALSLQDEIDIWRDFMADTRRATGNKTDIKWILGNHDIRLVTALAEAFPVFASLKSIRFHELFTLDKLKIGLVAKSTFLNPNGAMRKVDIAQNWETLPDGEGRPFWTTVHGFLHGKDAPKKHLDRFMTYGTNGHLHSPCSVSAGSYATGTLRWWQTGCMAWPEGVGNGYIQGPIEYQGWGSQFIVVTLWPWDRYVQVEEVTIDSRASFRGRSWFITEEEIAAREAMLVV